MNKGVWFGIGAYGLWGFLPIYWKAVQAVPSTEIVAHRTVWSLVFVALLLTSKGQWGWLKTVWKNPRTLLIVFASGTILGINWLIYIWGVNAGFVVETSLGYFINPLVNVLLGVLFLGEKMRRWQWVAIGLAATGVLYLTISYGSLPWIALVLAFTFGFYGLLKKKTSLNSLEGLSLETALLAVPALFYLLFLEASGAGSFGHTNQTISLLLVFTGVATGLPLLFFAAAARRIPLSTMGLLQYMAPTIQLFLGVFLYGEPFSPVRLIGFSFIWLALLIYSAEGLRQRHTFSTA
jgi:chloramphenicol-sensitive protein RarD